MQPGRLMIMEDKENVNPWGAEQPQPLGLAGLGQQPAPTHLKQQPVRSSSSTVSKGRVPFADITALCDTSGTTPASQASLPVAPVQQQVAIGLWGHPHSSTSEGASVANKRLTSMR